MEAIERRALHHYNGLPQNYLNEWLQRTGNTEHFDAYEVKTELEPETGITWGSIVKKGAADEAVAKITTQPYTHNKGETEAPAAASRGRGKSKAADKSHDPFE